MTDDIRPRVDGDGVGWCCESHDCPQWAIDNDSAVCHLTGLDDLECTPHHQRLAKRVEELEREGMRSEDAIVAARKEWRDG